MIFHSLVPCNSMIFMISYSVNKLIYKLNLKQKFYMYTNLLERKGSTGYTDKNGFNYFISCQLK